LREKLGKEERGGGEELFDGSADGGDGEGSNGVDDTRGDRCRRRKEGDVVGNRRRRVKRGDEKVLHHGGELEVSSVLNGLVFLFDLFLFASSFGTSEDVDLPARVPTTREFGQGGGSGCAERGVGG
jgi:hypothetical protein